MVLTFTGGMATEELCHNVSTIEDAITENMETFTLLLNSSEIRITIPIESVQVQITDNDGKLQWDII